MLRMYWRPVLDPKLPGGENLSTSEPVYQYEEGHGCQVIVFVRPRVNAGSGDAGFGGSEFGSTTSPGCTQPEGAGVIAGRAVDAFASIAPPPASDVDANTAPNARRTRRLCGR